MSSSAPISIQSLAAAYAQRMPAAQFFSHWTAAVLLGLRVPEWLVLSRLDVALPAPDRAPRLRGVRGHTLLPDVRVVDVSGGLRVSSAIDTWCQLAAELPLDDLIAMGDGLLRRNNPMATMAELELAVLGWGHRPGAPNLRTALPQLRARTDSARETRLRLVIMRAGLPEPMVNFEIRNRFGAFIGFADLAYPQFRILIEYDGGQHRESEAQFNRDVERLDEFMEEKWRVIRVNKELMRKHATLIGKITTALEAAGWRG